MSRISYWIDLLVVTTIALFGLFIYTRLEKVRFNRVIENKGFTKYVSSLGNEMWVNLEQIKDLETIDKHISNGFKDLIFSDFKNLLFNLFLKTGYNIELSSDNIDFIASERRNVILIKIVKNDQDQLTYEELEEFLASDSIKKYNSNKIIFITISDFTEEIYKLAKNSSIEIWNKEKLGQKIEESVFATMLINRKVPDNEEFKFYDKNTGYSAVDLREFIEILDIVEPDVLKHHIQSGEFEKWIRDQFQYNSLATTLSFRSGRDDTNSREYIILSKGGKVLRGVVINRVRETIFHDYCEIFGFRFIPNPSRNSWSNILEGKIWYPSPNLENISFEKLG